MACMYKQNQNLKEQNWRQNSAAEICEFTNHFKWEKLHTYYAEYNFIFDSAV